MLLFFQCHPCCTWHALCCRFMGCRGGQKLTASSLSLCVPFSLSLPSLCLLFSPFPSLFPVGSKIMSCLWVTFMVYNLQPINRWLLLTQKKKRRKKGFYIVYSLTINQNILDTEEPLAMCQVCGAQLNGRVSFSSDFSFNFFHSYSSSSPSLQLFLFPTLAPITESLLHHVEPPPVSTAVLSAPWPCGLSWSSALAKPQWSCYWTEKQKSRREGGRKTQAQEQASIRPGSQEPHCKAPKPEAEPKIQTWSPTLHVHTFPCLQQCCLLHMTSCAVDLASLCKVPG